jgi:hypothetical protein
VQWAGWKGEGGVWKLHWAELKVLHWEIHSGRPVGQKAVEKATIKFLRKRNTTVGIFILSE